MAVFKRLIGIALLLIATNCFAYDANTILLSHFDGADEAQVYTATTGQTVTFTASAKIDTAQKKFGVSALWLDGNSDYVSVPDEAGYDFGTGDFTLECWIYMSDNTSSQAVFDVGDYGSTGVGLIWVESGTHWYAYVNNDTVLNITTAPVTASAWYHVCLMRASGQLYFFLNGVAKGNDASVQDVTGLTEGVRIGEGNADPSYFFKGWIDEVRISNVARFPTTGFIPSQNPYNGRTSQLIVVK